MIDENNGNTIGNTLESFYDSRNNRWITNLTNTPSESFRFKLLINNQQVQRLIPTLNQPSLIQIEIIQVDKTSNNITILNYRLTNYYTYSIRLTLIVKNIGTYMTTKEYTMKRNESRNDQIEFDPKTKSNDITSDIITLTIKTGQTDWNYDVISF